MPDGMEAEPLALDLLAQVFDLKTRDCVTANDELAAQSTEGVQVPLHGGRDDAEMGQLSSPTHFANSARIASITAL